MAFCDFNNWTATVPTPPEAPSINIREPFAPFITKLPKRYSADHAVMLA